MAMPRLIMPEWLDTLPPSDPRARASRRDLRRINSIMGHAGFFGKELPRHFASRSPQNIVEIGSGDGEFLLTVARKLARRWPKLEVTIVDLQPAVTPDTLEAFQELGWIVDVVTADVFEWVSRCEAVDIIIANLFLHHFHDEPLAGLFQQLSSRTRVFGACEPRRSAAALAASRSLALIGCNDVTRHDGPVSVQAGFSGVELSALWPSSGGWQLDEAKHGFFSHGFVATRATRPA